MYLCAVCAALSVRSAGEVQWVFARCGHAQKEPFFFQFLYCLLGVCLAILKMRILWHRLQGPRAMLFRNGTHVVDAMLWFTGTSVNTNQITAQHSA